MRLAPSRSLVLALGICLTAGATLPRAAAAQQPAMRDSLLDHMIGRWTLTGTIAGQATTHDVSAEWVLGHHYVHLHEVSHERTADGQPQYEADAYIGWDPQARAYACVWLDVFGGVSPQSIGRAATGSDSLAFTFPSTGTADFHTTFVYERATDGWRWVMDNEENGTRKPFARLSMRRAR